MLVHSCSPTLAPPHSPSHARPPSHPMATRPPRGTLPLHQASQSFDGRLLLAMCRLQPCFIPICLLYSLTGALQSADHRSVTTPLSLLLLLLHGTSQRHPSGDMRYGAVALTVELVIQQSVVLTAVMPAGPRRRSRPKATKSQARPPIPSHLLYCFGIGEYRSPPNPIPDSAGTPYPRSNKTQENVGKDGMKNTGNR